MSNRYGANQYKQTSITTANRGQILLMLYEGAIQHLQKAIGCIQSKDVVGKGVALGKVHDIVNELTTTLDFEVGGNIARELERLYNFMTEQLLQANLENNVEKLKTVQKLLETLLEGWRGAVEQVNKGAAK
jgi:flagellar protein FliS